MAMKGGYTDKMWDSIKNVEATRKSRLGKQQPSMSLEEGEKLLKKYHPDYKKGNTREIKIGPSKGDPVVQ